MNQRIDPKDPRPVNPTAFAGDDAVSRTTRPTAGVDPLTKQPIGDPLARRPSDSDLAPPRATRSNWPILIILLAGLVLALLVWLPAEMSNDATTATPPAATTEPAAPATATPPAATATPPAATATPPAAAPTDAVTPPAATPPVATPPAAGTTTPPATGTAP